MLSSQTTQWARLTSKEDHMHSTFLYWAEWRFNSYFRKLEEIGWQFFHEQIGLRHDREFVQKKRDSNVGAIILSFTRTGRNFLPISLGIVNVFCTYVDDPSTKKKQIPKRICSVDVVNVTKFKYLVFQKSYLENSTYVSIFPKQNKREEGSRFLEKF